MKSLNAEQASLGKILKTEELLKERDNDRLPMDHFRNARFYDDGEVDADLHQCHTLDIKWEEDRKKWTPEQHAEYNRGLAAEYTFRHAIASYGWLSENVNLIVTSVYDDYVRGIDSIAQIILGPDRFEHLGFAIDFATGSGDVGVKIRRTFDSLDQGFTPSVKYFTSEKTGPLKNFKIPRIVVGAGPETLERLAAYSAEIVNNSSASESSKQEIRTDAFRAVLFGEIEAQLSVFVNRLKKVINQATEQNRPDIEKRALSSLAIHEKALEVTKGLAEKAGIKMTDIQQHIRGDIFANKMGQALSVLSQTPIEFRPQKGQ